MLLQLVRGPLQLGGLVARKDFRADEAVPPRGEAATVLVHEELVLGELTSNSRLEPS